MYLAIPFENVAVVVEFRKFRAEMQREISIDKLIHRLHSGLSHIFLHKLEHFALISRPNDETVHDEHHDEIPSEVSCWNYDL